MTWLPFFGRPLALLAAVGGVACSHGALVPPLSPTARARREGPASNDGEQVGRWLVGELLAPGGSAAGAKKARARLAKVGAKGMIGSFAAGLEATVHGRLQEGMHGFVGALQAAQRSEDPLAPLVAWVAAERLGALTVAAPDAASAARPVIDKLLRAPGKIGWRARSDLAQWSADRAQENAEPETRRREVETAGCLPGVRLAGPFGRRSDIDQPQVFPPEQAGPWPIRWKTDSETDGEGRVLPTEQPGCLVRGNEPVRAGVFYAESYIEVPTASEVVIAAQGAFGLWVDDRRVLERTPKTWGSWAKFGVQMRLGAGRHRLLARLAEPETSIRVLQPNGAPAVLRVGDPSGGAYGTSEAVVTSNPNVLSRYLSGKDRSSNPAPTGVTDEFEMYLVSDLASMESQYDVASWLLEPLLADRSQAAPLVLAAAAAVVERDPVFPANEGRDVAKILRQQAAERDPELWWPRLWLLEQDAERSAAEAARGVAALETQFPEVPDIGRLLDRLYERLGWRAERARHTLAMATRFPRDRSVLEASIGAFESAGRRAEAEETAARVRKLYPDSEIDLDRALDRRDYPAAVAELRRLGARRPDRRDITARLADVLLQSGEGRDPLPLLEAAVRQRPRDPAARFALADGRLAQGNRSALRTELATSLEKGLPSDELRGALELVEGATEFAPYRLDGRDVIRAFEASGVTLAGTAARVIDYGVVWIRPDGRARMLEHELVRVQSQEAVGKLTEQHIPPGAVVLRLRVLKKNGQILEPERIEGKPTVTMPHLEVGDYLETETIGSTLPDGEGGKRYLGPQWFFREADIAYWRSEFVVISPRSRPLTVDTSGPVPTPVVIEQGPLMIRRWRVDQSPAAPVEPGSPPLKEFLPSVRVGWGVTFADQLARLRDAVREELPYDPRLVRIAQRIVGNAPPSNPFERARRLYRWLMSNVEEGKETDGRKIVIGKSGNRAAAFLYLARALHLPIELAAVRNRLTPPHQGPLAEALSYSDIVLRLAAGTKPGARPLWFTVGDKFAPFGFLPAEVRGQPAVRLIPALARDTTTVTGSVDGTVYEGSVDLHVDGSATFHVALRFVGRLAVAVRGSLEQIPEPQIRGVLESRLLGRALPGSRLVDFTLEDKDDPDRPLTIRTHVEVPNFARRSGATLNFKAPFLLMIGALAELPTRRTPRLLAEATHTEVRLVFKLPAGGAVEGVTAPEEVREGDRVLRVADQTTAGTFRLDRTIDVPAGRVAVEEYERFRRFVQDVDTRSAREIIVRLP